jgi:8-hydroxy-5-deazaflavin:NADPH oxidoreductase
MRQMHFPNAQIGKLTRVIALAALAIALWSAPRALFGQSAGTSAKLKIGVIGSGNIGGTVGTLWVKAGHQVMFSSRHPEELKPLVDRLGSLARTGTVQEALTFGEVIFIGVPYGAYPQIGKDYAGEFQGKIVLDAGNAVLRRDGEIANEAREIGIGKTSVKYLPGARIVRTFNTMSFRRLESNANRPGARMAIPIAGDDKEAIAVAQSLVRDAGFDPVLVGDLDSAKLFAQGAPLYGQDITAQEMEQRLKSLR